MLFPRELVCLAVDSFWVALLVFLPPFSHSSPFGFAFFLSLAGAVWFSPVCFASALAKVGQEAAAAHGKGWVKRNMRISHGSSPKDENKLVELG